MSNVLFSGYAPKVECKVKKKYKFWKDLGYFLILGNSVAPPFTLTR